MLRVNSNQILDYFYLISNKVKNFNFGCEFKSTDVNPFK